MQNERQLVEGIVNTLDRLFDERSEKAKNLAVDIAALGQATGNEDLRRVFESVADHYRYEATG